MTACDYIESATLTVSIVVTPRDWSLAPRRDMMNRSVSIVPCARFHAPKHVRRNMIGP